ncbi:transcriptional regulator [Methanocaldococcus sp. 28A]
MKIIRAVPEEFLNELYLIPTDRENLLELDENGNFEVVNNIPIIRILATPNLKKTIAKIVYQIKDKYYLFKDYKKASWLKNLLEYINNKIKFDKYYRAKKAWYRGIGDLFKNIRKWEFEKVIRKIISLLKVLNPIIVFEVHDIRKWHCGKSFINFVKELRKNNLSVVIRYPIDCHEEIREIFPDGILNTKSAIKYFAKVHGYYISNNVADYLLKITNGNLETIYLILRHSKREIKNLRELKIPWLKILPYIVDSKYRKLVESIIELRKFKVEDIIYKVNYKLSTLYRYLDELVELGILTKIKHKGRVRFKIRLNRNILLELIKKSKNNYFHWFSIFLLDSIPWNIRIFEFSKNI